MFIAYGGVFLRMSPHHAFSTVQNGRGQGQPRAAGAATSGPPLGSPAVCSRLPGLVFHLLFHSCEYQPSMGDTYAACGLRIRWLSPET